MLVKVIDCKTDEPLYNWGGMGARPDFVTTGRKDGKEFTLVVETMGTEDPDYSKRKNENGQTGWLQGVPGAVVQKEPSSDQALMKYILGARQEDLL